MIDFSIGNFTTLLRDALHKELEVKTDWGRNDVKLAFEEALQTAFAKCLEEMERKACVERGG
jgi:hypothetical protein